ncbi:MAG TPA: TonB-dependent receptor [Pseudomonadales bacterium]
MYFKRKPLAAITGTLLAAISAPAVHAQSADSIEVIQVRALAIDENARIVAPFSAIDRQAILGKGGTLGDLLSGLPGVHSDSFGGGSSRPVVRGQTSPRVRVLSDSSTLFDASDISPDHAVASDTLLARRIEVLRGPATLLYGGGAVGGVVNVIDGKIPTELSADAPYEGGFSLRGNTVADEAAGAGWFDANIGAGFVVHLEGSRRDTDDYEADGWDAVAGTYSESNNTALGLSWIGEDGYLGVAYSYRDDNYGVPGHNHEYEGCHPHGSELHCGSHEEEDEEHDHEHEDELEPPPWVELDSERFDVRGEWRDPVAGIHRVRLRASHTDYEHDEVEAGLAGTNFANKSWEARVDMDHAPVFGWHGVVGAQIADTRFSAAGAEAFLPHVDSRTSSLFAVEHYDISDAWHIEAGLRHERQEHDPVNDARNRPSFDSDSLSYSGALIWSFATDYTASVTLSRAQRLPHAQELYARGIHLATNTYECGLVRHPLTCGGAENNADLGRETSTNVDLALQKHAGPFTFSVNMYRNSVDDYVYARTLDQYEDFRLIKYTQQDVEFNGMELQADVQLSEAVSVGVFGDYVRAEFDAGGNLPRISPRRAGARASYAVGNITSQVEYTIVSSQDDIAAYETVTPGYKLLNATVNVNLLPDERLTLTLRGSNLLDDEVWNHTSFLADVIPMPGRNVSLGMNYSF